MKDNPKSARDTNKTIEWKKSQKCERYREGNNRMNGIPKSARDTNVII